MPRDPSTVLEMVIACRHIIEFTRGMNYEQFSADRMKQSAVMYQIAVIGEATRRLSPGFREAHRNVPWPEIASMRNRLIHEYDDIDDRLVWDAVTLNIPDLLRSPEPLSPSHP